MQVMWAPMLIQVKDNFRCGIGLELGCCSIILLFLGHCQIIPNVYSLGVSVCEGMVLITGAVANNDRLDKMLRVFEI